MTEASMWLTKCAYSRPSRSHFVAEAWLLVAAALSLMLG